MLPFPEDGCKETVGAECGPELDMLSEACRGFLPSKQIPWHYLDLCHGPLPSHVLYIVGSTRMVGGTN
jgi:hypothetical protein